MVGLLWWTIIDFLGQELGLKVEISLIIIEVSFKENL